MTTASVSPAPSSRLTEPGKPPNAPLLEQGEWPPSEFGSTEFNVDLESALEFEEWEARGRRMGKGGSYLPNSLPPYLDGLGLELPSPTFVPLSAGSTVTTVTGGAQTNNPRSRQGFRDRIMQPLRKKPQEPHTVRSVISPTFGYPSRSHDPNTALNVDGAPAAGVSMTRSHESRSRSSTQNARRLKHARTRSSRSIQQVQEYSSSGERQSSTPPEERRERSAEAMEIAPFAEPEDVPSEPVANPSSKACGDETPASIRKEQQLSRGNFNKSISLGFGGHRSRISSSLFSWIRPSSRSRQEARNNIKALSCSSRQPDEVGSPLTRISGSYFTPPIHATPPGESTSSPLPEQAPGEATTTTSPSSITAPFLSASELSTQKTPFAFTNGLSYSHGSENSSVNPAVALFGANPFGGVSTTIVGGADANKGSAGNARPRGKLMRSMSFKAPHH
ncbi:hypothetical protein KEM55_007530 [Ascosphaera atra]|nr:hypothetical protein KEM55_007530 [Ascosphaera atra]